LKKIRKEKKIRRFKKTFVVKFIDKNVVAMYYVALKKGRKNATMHTYYNICIYTIINYFQ